MESAGLFQQRGASRDGNCRLAAGEDGGKANFGFNFHCDGEDSKGQLTYHDKSADLKIKGTVTGCEFGLNKVTVLGDYVGQGKSVYKAGSFEVVAIDKDEPAAGEDVLHIWLDEDDEDDCHNVGKLLGGNIQDHG